jgi:ABC-type glucose/galactose transport system permease subunit
LVPSISTVIILIAIYYAISGLSFPFTYALIVMGLYIIFAVVMDIIFSGKKKNVDYRSQ